MKCNACGYDKNDPSQGSCNLCGAKLDMSTGITPAADNRFGAGKNRRDREIKKTIQTEGPKEDQIVYAGDFAIVYVFSLLEGGLIILKPGEVFTFGRGDAADHKIDAKVVSRRHARVHWSGSEPPIPEIVDLDSKNGISVNGIPVSRKVLEDADELTIGPFSAELRVLSANVDLDSQIQTDRLSATTIVAQRLAGEVKLISVPWLLTHLERTKESGTLTVQHERLQGYVVLISGVAIAAGYAQDGEQKQAGEEAIRQVAKMRQGRFTFSQRADAPPQPIGKTLREILGPPRRRGPPQRRTGRRPPPPRQR